MIGKQLLQTSQLELIVTAKGADLKEASASIFKQIQQQVYKEIEKPLIQMETEAVYFDEIEEVAKDGFLAKKDKTETIVKARVILNVKYLEI